ncbi:hypothetical protein GCM10027610_070140 [Dactylosporangium cerinum]
MSFTFDQVYSQYWVLMNQLTMITPMPKAWDRTAEGPADASHDIEQVEAVFDYLLAHNGSPTAESNAHRVLWPEPDLERRQRALEAADVHRGGRRHVRAERALQRPEPGPAGGVPAAADRDRRAGVRAAAAG